MANSYKILFIGDVVGKPGRNALADGLSCLQDKHQPLFTIVNGENSAGGVGITPDIAEEFYKLGVDGITLGNHTFNKREIMPYLAQGKAIIRPSNMPEVVPGRGLMNIEREGIELAVMNLCGRVFLDTYDDPFREVDRLLESIQTSHILLDMHAEATSEKIAMGFYLSGKVTAVIGTHTHVPTADEQVLPGGTAYITDVGMTGPWPSVLGMDKDVVISKFRTTLPVRFEVAQQPGVICGAVVTADRVSGRATAIERIRYA